MKPLKDISIITYIMNTDKKCFGCNEEMLTGYEIRNKNFCSPVCGHSHFNMVYGDEGGMWDEEEAKLQFQYYIKVYWGQRIYPKGHLGFLPDKEVKWRYNTHYNYTGWDCRFKKLWNSNELDEAKVAFHSAINSDIYGRVELVKAMVQGNEKWIEYEYGSPNYCGMCGIRVNNTGICETCATK